MKHKIIKMIGFSQLLFAVCIVLLPCTSCEKDELVFEENDITIEVKTGENWEHDFPLFLGFSQKNTPQFAIWIEDTTGNYLSTIFVTEKIATQGWIMSGGNRRKEALPYWCHQRGITYDDGLMLPSKKEPITDGITGATPNGNKSFLVRLKDFSEPIVIKAEFNHSVDFNDNFPEDASTDSENYSGGSKGSGQPAVVYSATIAPDCQQTELKLIGHSSADGSNGNLYGDTSKLTSALSIVESITITVTR